MVQPRRQIEPGSAALKPPDERLISPSAALAWGFSKGNLAMNDEAVLSNDDRFTSFSYNDQVIRFKTSPRLERYTKIVKWDNGYIVVMAIYNGVETEDYIDLIPILENLCINPEEFLNPIKKVRIQ